MAYRTSLVVQWVIIHLPMQGTPVWSLVGEDSTCCRAAKPIATTTEPAHLDPVCPNKRSPRTTVKNSPRSLKLQKVHQKKKRKKERKKGWHITKAEFISFVRR